MSELACPIELGMGPLIQLPDRSRALSEGKSEKKAGGMVPCSHREEGVAQYSGRTWVELNNTGKSWRNSALQQLHACEFISIKELINRSPDLRSLEALQSRSCHK